MTLQEIVDIVYKGAAAQKWYKSSRGGQCAYRGRNGCKCHAGHLIPDDKYDPSMEGKGASSRQVSEALGLSRVDSEHLKAIHLISDLQNDHDISKTPQQRKLWTEATIRKHGLTIPSA